MGRMGSEIADMFSKVGGHSSGLILEDTPEASYLTDFLYSNEYDKRDKDPILLAQD